MAPTDAGSGFPCGRRALAVAISAALSGVHGARADQAIEEIIVTATKREASLQDIPQVVTAFTGADIERRGFSGLDDYAKFVPSLNFARRGESGTSLVFRGISAGGIQFTGVQPSASLYLDEQPLTTLGLNPDPRLVDIERVEALSGPQGTLFGASSQSGTLRIITNKPDASAFDSWIDVSGSKVEHGGEGYDLSAMINVPIIEDVLAIRLVGFRAEEAGYVDNVLGTSPGGTFDNAAFVDDDVNSRTVQGGRLTGQWDPNERFRATVTATYQDVEFDGLSDFDPRVGDLEQVRFFNEHGSDEWYQIGLTLEGDLGFADFVSATSYFSRDLAYTQDATAYDFALNQLADQGNAAVAAGTLPYNPYILYDFGGDPRGFVTNDQPGQERLSTEFRLTSPTDSTSRWGWLVGTFYDRQVESYTFRSRIPGYTATPAFAAAAYYYGVGPTDTWFDEDLEQVVKQVAVFGEVSFDVTDRFTITAGGRWYKFWRDFFDLQQTPRGHLSSIDNNSSGDDGWVPKVNLTYRFDDDKMVYFTYSEGFRVGGANPIRPRSIAPATFDPDKLKNYEAGAKTRWLDGRFLLNVTGYHMEWEEFQIQINDPTPGLFSLIAINLPNATIDGVEANFVWLPPLEGLDVSGAVAWNDARLAETVTQFGLNTPAGTPLPLSPDWKATLSLQYNWQQRLFGAEPYVRFDFAHVGESVNSLSGIESFIGQRPVRTQAPYDTGDLKLGLEHDNWSASFFVDNLWDERAEMFYNNRWADNRLSTNQPRTFGIKLRRRFH
ncbi:MAG: TonB-dependent receptor [Gammaproteobacteria bacterium]|nr:TonB-dependent receptor [Gammaproteobacteria bacterium]